MLKKNLSVIMLTLVILIFSSCNSSNSERSDPDYISITYTTVKPEIEGGQFTSQILSYDSKTKEMSKIFEFEYTSQYPLGYYDKKEQVVYFTRSVGDETNYADQIFVHDLTTKKEEQLTDQLFAINSIIPTEDKIYFVASPKGVRSLRLGSIDKKTKEIVYWENIDSSVEAIAIDQKNKKIFVSSFSEKERQYNVIHQEGPVGQDNFKMPRHAVFRTDYDFKKTDELFGENSWIRSIMTKDNHVIAIVDKKYNNSETPSVLYNYNLTDNTQTKETWDTARMQNGDPDYSSDEQKIYTISTIDDRRGLYEYDVESKKFIPIFTPDSGFINNIIVVKNN